MLNIAANSILLSGSGIKSCILATLFFWQYAPVAGAAIASLSHQKIELHLPSVHASEGCYGPQGQFV